MRHMGLAGSASDTRSIFKPMIRTCGCFAAVCLRRGLVAGGHWQWWGPLGSQREGEGACWLPAC